MKQNVAQGLFCKVIKPVKSNKKLSIVAKASGSETDPILLLPNHLQPFDLAKSDDSIATTVWDSEINEQCNSAITALDCEN